MFTARQTFLHLACPEHIEKTINASEHFLMVNNLMRMMVGEWRVLELIDEASEKVKAQFKRWLSIYLTDPELFQGGSQQLTGLDEFIQMSTIVPIAETAEMLIEEVQKYSGSWMQNLTTEIGKSMVRCIPCKLIFGNAVEYYIHLTTFFHIRNADTFDHNTLIVNIEKRFIARLQPW
ncbi:hypothetical protein PMAYCL1PPCAC_01267, partial [Pristionchus mayeri]